MVKLRHSRKEPVPNEGGDGNPVSLITDNLDVWTTAIQKKSATGRGSKKKISLHGIKKLRELILELAVRGQLVPQDSNDEPASILLEKIAKEKDRLIAEGKIKKQKALTAVEESQKTFNLPCGWEWIKLGNISNFVNGYAFKSSDFIDEGVGIIKIGDIQDGLVCSSKMSRVSENLISNLDDVLRVESGEMVIAMSGATTGKLGFNQTSEVFYLNQRVGKIVPYLMSVNYLYFPLTTKIKENLEKSMGSAIPNLSTTQINNITFAVPSLAEQHRIVTKVNELMALCDQLEQQTESSITAHQTLVKTLLTTLTNSENAAVLQQNWAKIETHFDTLFTTEHSIDQLKQTILQLAVMGKLVPQNPNDEPASVLLEKIAAEKEKLIKDKKIKKQKPLPDISEDEKPFELPVGWEWIRIDDLIEPARGISYGIIKLEKEPAVGGVLTLRCSDVKPRYIELSNVRRVSEEIEIPYLRTRLQGGEVLLNIRGTLGGVALVPEELAGYNIAREVAMLPFYSYIEGMYAVNLIASPYFWNLIEQNLKGIAYKGLNLSILRLIPIPIPPRKEQKNIISKVDELFSKCDQILLCLKKNQTTKLYLSSVIVDQAVS